jgi:hypothetical protein
MNGGRAPKRILAGVMLAGFALTLISHPAGAKPLGSSDKKKAIAAVELNWGECLALVGESTADAKARKTNAAETGRPIDKGASPVLVTLATGEQFVYQLHGRLKGAATANQAAESTLDRAAAAGGDC